MSQDVPDSVSKLPWSLRELVDEIPFKVDGDQVEFVDHAYLEPIYKAINFDPKVNPDGFKFACMKGTQVGMSVTMFGALVLTALKFWGKKMGYFMPTQALTNEFSSDRFAPLLHSNPFLSSLYTELPDSGRWAKEDRKGLRKIGASSIYFRYMHGKVSTEAIPMTAVFFDEVREMLRHDIEKADERLSHAVYPINFKFSTAGYPDCFAGETMITARHRASGMILPIPIRDLVERWKDFDVLSYNRVGGNRPRWRKLLGAVCRGIRPMVKVKLWGGTSIRCTASHRFAICRPASRGLTFDWLPIGEVPRRLHRFGGVKGPDGVLTVTQFPDVYDPKKTRYDAPFDLLTCYAVGAFIAEGTLQNKCLEFWQNPGKPLRSKVQAWAAAQGLAWSENNEAVTVSLSRRRDLLALFMACGGKADSKQVPECILGGSSQQLSILLEGLLDGDGHRRLPRTSTKAARKEWDFYTNSDQLAMQVMFICRRLALVPARHTRPARNQSQPSHCVSYNRHSFHAQAVMKNLAPTAIESMSNDGTDLAYDLQVEGTPWFVLAESGALVHNSTIHEYFKESDQRVWYSKCRCKDGIDLAWHWPECVGERNGDVFWRCPRCDKRINNPRIGGYRARTPEHLKEHRTIGFHIPQIISPRHTAASLWAKWLRMTDRKEFYNAGLGIPWVDPTNILVPETVARACVRQDLKWARKGENCVMGVDQRGGENHVFIADRSQGKKLIIRHLEIIQGDDPFARLYPLMEQFDVDCCIIDALPQYNEAVRFAKAFKRRVFLAYYTNHVHMIRWSDRDEELQSIQRTAKDAKFEFHVMIDRYKAIEHTLMQWVLRQIACPPPEALTQEVRVQGMKRLSQICLGSSETKEQGLFYHLRSVARRKVEKQRRDAKAKKTFETGEFVMEWENIGIDPHFLHAMLYCTVASSRRAGGGVHLWTDAAPQDKTVTEVLAEKPDMTATQAGDMLQIQQRALPMIQAADAARPRLDGTCSACRFFEVTRHFCQERRMGTQAAFPACEAYEQSEESA